MTHTSGGLWVSSAAWARRCICFWGLSDLSDLCGGEAGGLQLLTLPVVGLEGLHQVLVLNTEESSVYTASDIKVVRMNLSWLGVLKLWVGGQGGHVMGVTSWGSWDGHKHFVYMYVHIFFIYIHTFHMCVHLNAHIYGMCVTEELHHFSFFLNLVMNVRQIFLHKVLGGSRSILPNSATQWSVLPGERCHWWRHPAGTRQAPPASQGSGRGRPVSSARGASAAATGAEGRWRAYCPSPDRVWSYSWTTQERTSSTALTSSSMMMQTQWNKVRSTFWSTDASAWGPSGLYFSIPSIENILFAVCSGCSSRISMACWKQIKPDMWTSQK